MKNLIVNGCSFTDDSCYTTWASCLSQKKSNINYHNLGRSGAGNDYINQSTIAYLENHDLDPAETLLVIMWSGTGRKDLCIASDWWHHLQEYYQVGCNIGDQEYYIFSGGLSNSWTTTAVTQKIFEWPYKLSDPITLCRDTMLNIINLENYLRVHGYHYRFTSYVNYWRDDQTSNFHAGNYSMDYWLKDLALYKNYDFEQWFFVNEQKDCIKEFVAAIDQLDHTGHPTVLGHQLFCDQIVIPKVQQILF